MKNISYNFGAIRDSITRLSSMELIRENKSDTLDSFVKKTNSSPNLKKQQLIYKNIQECKPFSKERLAERFLNQNLNMFKNSKWQDILKENMSLRKEFLGNPDVSHVEARYNGELFESINTLIESVCNPSFSDFEKEGISYDMVVEYLTREVGEEEGSKEVDDSPSLGESWKFVTKLAVNNFNKRYEHLNESEKEVLSILTSENSKKEEYLNSIKNENINKINSIIESDNIDKLNYEILMEFKTKIERISHVSPNEIDDYILECIDLKQTLEEL